MTLQRQNTKHSLTSTALRNISHISVLFIISSLSTSVNSFGYWSSNYWIHKSEPHSLWSLTESQSVLANLIQSLAFGELYSLQRQISNSRLVYISSHKGLQPQSESKPCGLTKLEICIQSQKSFNGLIHTQVLASGFLTSARSAWMHLWKSAMGSKEEGGFDRDFVLPWARGW